jgi:hypothetical protein
VNTIPSAPALARAFSRLMVTALKAKELKEVRRRNLLPEYEDACASHDFLDANMVMALAWAELTGGAVFMDFPTMNAAWDMARAHGFKAEAINEAK